MYRSILVPLDGSSFGEHALPLALTLARKSGATLHLVHVHTPLQAVYAEIQLYDDQLDAQVRERSRQYLHNMAQSLQGLTATPINAVQYEGEVESIICELATSMGIDLVVMTTHARGPMGRFWLGSVADKLIRDLTMPLLLVHPQDIAANIKQEVAIKHMLLPLDGTSLAEQMLEPAIALGSLMGSRYTLLRVIRPLMPMPTNLEGETLAHMAQSWVEKIEKVHEQDRQAAKDYLEGVAKQLRSRSLEVATEVAVEEKPALAILHHAQPPFDLIAMETHGRRGLSRLFMGSVADKVIRGAHLPILVHRPVIS